MVTTAIRLTRACPSSPFSCGSSPGASPDHLAAARALAQAFHRHGIQLVYGGGTTGIMGELGRTLVSLSGMDAVDGVIPEALLSYERANTGIDEERRQEYGRVTVVADMHSRKALMAEKVKRGGPGSGFVALSGGIGTVEELMEATTWQQIGIHARGICLLNVDGFWDGLVAWVSKVAQAGFLREEDWAAVGVKEDVEDVIKWLRDWKVERRVKLDWNPEETDVI